MSAWAAKKLKPHQVKEQEKKANRPKLILREGRTHA